VCNSTVVLYLPVTAIPPFPCVCGGTSSTGFPRKNCPPFFFGCFLFPFPWSCSPSFLRAGLTLPLAAQPPQNPPIGFGGPFSPPPPHAVFLVFSGPGNFRIGAYSFCHLDFALFPLLFLLLRFLFVSVFSFFYHGMQVPDFFLIRPLSFPARLSSARAGGFFCLMMNVSLFQPPPFFRVSF